MHFRAFPLPLPTTTPHLFCLALIHVHEPDSKPQLLNLRLKPLCRTFCPVTTQLHTRLGSLRCAARDSTTHSRCVLGSTSEASLGLRALGLELLGSERRWVYVNSLQRLASPGRGESCAKFERLLQRRVSGCLGKTIRSQSLQATPRTKTYMLLSNPSNQ